jgi:hypothetical protein
VSQVARELDLLARELEWPAQPELAERVRAQIDAGRPAPSRAARRRRRVPRRLAIALAALAVLMAALMAAVPSARDAVLDLVGLDGATVEVRPSLPGREVGRELDLGPPTTLARARRAADFDVLVPGALGRPRSVHLSRSAPGGEVTLVYGARERPLLVSQFRGDLAPEYVGKIAGQATRVQRLRGGVYLAGAPHFFFYRTPDGAIREDSLRLARDVLLLERGELLVRVEGAGTLERARAITASLR